MQIQRRDAPLRALTYVLQHVEYLQNQTQQLQEEKFDKEKYVKQVKRLTDTAN